MNQNVFQDSASNLVLEVSVRVRTAKCIIENIRDYIPQSLGLPKVLFRLG